MIAKAVEDISLTAKEKALDRTAGAGFTEALRTAKNAGFDLAKSPITGRFQNPLNPYTHLTNANTALADLSEEAFFKDLPQLNKTIADPRKLQDVLSAAQENGIDTNVKKVLQQYQFSKIFNNATSRDIVKGVKPSNVVRINPESFNKDWLKSEMQDSLKKLYSANQRADIEQFFKNVAYTQEKIEGNPIAKKFWVMRGAVGISAGLLTGGITGSHIAMPVGAIGALVGAEAVGKLLTNPKTARIMVALAGGEPLGVTEQYAARAIVQGLAGSTIALLNADGSKTPVQIDQKGQMNPVGQ